MQLPLLLIFIQVMVLFEIGCIWILSISSELGLLVKFLYNHSILVQINACVQLYYAHINFVVIVVENSDQNLLLPRCCWYSNYQS